MRREYKGFYIEPAGGGSGRSRNGYSAYHVVTGNLAVSSVPTLKDARDEIDSIHNDVRTYAACAGCDPIDLTLKRGRWVTDQRTIPRR